MLRKHRKAECPILARSGRKGGIPQLSNPRDFDRPMPCQTSTAPTSVESRPFDSAQGGLLTSKSATLGRSTRREMVISLIMSTAVRFALTNSTAFVAIPDRDSRSSTLAPGMHADVVRPWSVPLQNHHQSLALEQLCTSVPRVKRRSPELWY
jgi:hypothetical protein